MLNMLLVLKEAGDMQMVDSRIIQKIHTLVVETGVRTVPEIRRHVDVYIKQIFEGQQLPSRPNRRFYPSDKDIRNHINSALVSMQ